MPRRCSGIFGREKNREPLEERGVPIPRNGTENAKEMVFWQDCQKAETDERGGFQAAAEKVRMRGENDVIETGNLLVELGADPTNKPVAKWRHPAQKNRRTWLGAPIGLWQWRERHIARVHCGLRSAVV